jgi:hypothetical protein
MFDQKPLRTVAKKLEAIRLAMQHEFPTADVDIMLAEIEKGRSETAAPTPALRKIDSCKE